MHRSSPVGDVVRGSLQKAFLLAALLCPSSPIAAQLPAPGELVLDVEARTLRFQAVAQKTAFENSVPPDHQYHALVHSEGGAAGKSLFTTEVRDTEIARVLRELGAEDGGGVPMAAWNLRWVPLVSQPTARVQGSRLRISIDWAGSPRSYSLGELLIDPGQQGVDLRFGGNEEHDDHWGSGCIICLFSCPGGVISNASYTIRDHQRGVTSFEAGPEFPSDGQAVVFTIELLSSG